MASRTLGSCINAPEATTDYDIPVSNHWGCGLNVHVERPDSMAGQLGSFWRQKPRVQLKARITCSVIPLHSRGSAGGAVRATES